MFDRKPSARYQEYLDLHALAHQEGLTKRLPNNKTSVHSGQEVFQGSEITLVTNELQHLAAITQAKHLLDFGCGKAMGYYNTLKVNGRLFPTVHEAIGIDPASVFLYDPAMPEYAHPPRDNQYFDLVVCTDVLEHIPEEDTDMVLDYLFEKCNKALVLSISCADAYAILANGENAHVNVKPTEWWIEKLSSRLEKKQLHLYTKMSFFDEDGEQRKMVFQTK